MTNSAKQFNRYLKSEGEGVDRKNAIRKRGVKAQGVQENGT
jgi:hypothetical protein